MLSIQALVDVVLLLAPKLEELAVCCPSIEMSNETELFHVLKSAVERLDDEMRPLGEMHLADISRLLFSDSAEEQDGDD